MVKPGNPGAMPGFSGQDGMVIPVEIVRTTRNGVSIVTLAGRMDDEGTRIFREARGNWTGNPVVLDLTRVEYMGSAGLEELRTMKKEYLENRNIVVLTGDPGLVSKIIRIDGFEKVFAADRPGDRGTPDSPDASLLPEG